MGTLSDAQWQLIEPILRPKRRSDGRGRPWQDTRAVLDGVLWVLGTGAQWREPPNNIRRTRPATRFQQWVGAGKLERILQVPAEELQAQGRLQLKEVFIDGSFTAAKKVASRPVPPNAARERKSFRSPMITVFLFRSYRKRFAARQPAW